jgi:hypothetical protein
LDGRLTSLDRLAKRVPEAKTLIRATAIEAGLLPEAVQQALASYPSRPAEWLTDREFTAPGQAEIDLLVNAIVGVLKDGHREAVIKCLFIWSGVQAGTLSTSLETIELLKLYPHDLASRDRADSCIRAMWGAYRGLLLHENKNHFAEAQSWARTFWGVNSMTSQCVRRRDLATDDNAATEGPLAMSEDTPAAGTPSPGTAPPGGAHLRQLAMDLFSSYVEALETAPSRLYDHEMQEVHSGLVARAAREVVMVLGAPDLWSVEHGSHVVRVLVEVRIYLQWMAQQDTSIYHEFQAYGAGKAKLYARIMDELPEEARTAGFATAIDDLEKLSHNDDVIDHRIVDTRDSFAEGKSIRSMAEECGLLDFYRQAYYMASGVAHSEWWSIEAHAMERCMNVLHGGHLIPSLSLDPGGRVDLANSWVDLLYALIRISLGILGTDERAVDSAFAWLKAESDEPSSDLDDEDPVGSV